MPQQKILTSILRSQLRWQILPKFCSKLQYPLLFLAWICSVTHCLEIAVAQTAPDNTLGSQNSTVIPGAVVINGQPADIIAGGATRGSNLFHSFLDFNVAEGQQIYFRNPAGVARIISRVTGNRPSNILGRLGIQGNADLFLINSNGIFFGPNSRLDLNGSFLGTTANRLIFEQGLEFGTDNPQVPSQLAINVPLGLQFNRPSADIVAQGTGHQLISPNPLFAFSIRTGSSELDLTVKPTKTLALIGRNINLNGRILTAPGGSIHLGGVTSGVVQMTPTSLGWGFNYQTVQSFGDINLSQQALVDGSGISTGSINIQGRRVSITDGSVIRIQNLGNQAGRPLSINASDSLQLIGTNPQATTRSSLTAQSLGLGRGSDIVLSTPMLFLREGGVIFAGTVGPGEGGTLRIDAAESIDVLGTSPLNPSLLSLLSTGAFGAGNAGDTFITTKRLSVSDGGLVTSATLGQGHGGDVTVNASELVKLVGVGPTLFANSAVSASSLERGDAGNLVINTQRLVIKDGARVDASTFASGAAGSVTVNATDSIQVSGVAPGGRDSSFIISSANLLSPELRNTFNLPPIPTGEAGNVQITTKDLSVTNGGSVSVKNDGPGDAGTLQVYADNILLEQQAGITASTISGNGGDIDLRIHNRLLMRNESLVSATANGPGDGGNININADLIVAFPNENSDIVANSFSGRGGKISITTQGVFGLKVRDQRTNFSDITAISQSDPTLNGIVEINNPEVDPNNSLIDLPESVDVSPPITQGCRTGQPSGTSRFVHTGRGGLPPGPGEPQTAVTLWHDLRELNVQKPTSHSMPLSAQTHHRTTALPKSSDIVEAQGWVHDAQGRTVLTANFPDQPGLGRRQSAAMC
ncbi:S-layer family protein [Acaryochloris sp. IP29b_bin.148]|uniref:beta strand repeat-containing protein n=1 Tax=Acaryochloris sp. IP29b_bin.148 TaxID=2969218 RepID=UPI0026084979|nr:S-layer family protein [Acaryochloris sp. IP29b_bin.148]